MSNIGVSTQNYYATSPPSYYGPAPSTGTNTGGYNPYNVGSGSSSTYGDDSFSSITSLVSPAAGGGFAAYKLSGKMAESIKSIFAKKPPAGDPATAGLNTSGVMGGLKNVAITSIKGAGLAALVGAGVSAVGNGIGVATGAVDGSQAVSNVIGDTVTSAVGGLGAVALGGAGHMLLSKFGVGGMAMTITTTALGAVGGVAAGFIKQSIME